MRMRRRFGSRGAAVLPPRTCGYGSASRSTQLESGSYGFANSVRLIESATFW